MSAKDTQVGGNHYKNFKIQPIEFITANNVPYIEGNIIKYVMRHKMKNGIEDLKKASHYLQMLIEMEEKRVTEIAIDAAADYQLSVPECYNV